MDLGESQFLTEFDLEGQNLAPDVKLFRRVIAQAVDDAFMAMTERKPGTEKKGLTSSVKKQRNLEYEKALRWFQDDDDDFRMIAHMADLEPEKIRQHVLNFEGNLPPSITIQKTERARRNLKQNFRGSAKALPENSQSAADFESLSSKV